MKRLLFSLYLLYIRMVPAGIGKGFATRCILRLGLTTYSTKGLVLELNPGSWIDRTLILGGSHDASVSSLLEERLAGGGVFVDIGANIGLFSLEASRMRDVLVFAFEPSPPELERLYRNLALNSTRNVVVFPVGLGRESGDFELILGPSENPGTNSFVGVVGGARRGSVSCRCERFDSIFPPDLLAKVKVVKIDVEGFEVSVLDGMSGAIKEMGDVAFMVEVTPEFLARSGSSAEALYAFFEEHGFHPRCGLQPSDQWDEVFCRNAN